MTNNPEPSKPLWQLILMYPQLIIFAIPILSSLIFTISQAPVILRAVKHGIAIDQAQIEIVTEKMLQQYVPQEMCKKTGKTYINQSGSNKSTVKVQSCLHDILLVTVGSEDTNGFGKVGFLALPYPNVLRPSNGMSSDSTVRLQVLTEPVFANDLIKSPDSKQTFTVICTKFQSNNERYLMRRIRDDSTGKCYEETIDTATGNIIDRKEETTCDPNC